MGYPIVLLMGDMVVRADLALIPAFAAGESRWSCRSQAAWLRLHGQYLCYCQPLAITRPRANLCAPWTRLLLHFATVVYTKFASNDWTAPPIRNSYSTRRLYNH
jgi:hypothetical protein